MVAPMFGAPAGVAMLARSVASARAGAVSRWSVMVHSLVLLVFILPLRGLVGHIPVAALAAVTVVVGAQLADWRRFRGAAADDPHGRGALPADLRAGRLQRFDRRRRGRISDRHVIIRGTRRAGDAAGGDHDPGRRGRRAGLPAGRPALLRVERKGFQSAQPGGQGPAPDPRLRGGRAGRFGGRRSAAAARADAAGSGRGIVPGRARRRGSTPGSSRGGSSPSSRPRASISYSRRMRIHHQPSGGKLHEL